MKSKVVKGTSASALESRLNTALEEVSEFEIVDVKVAGAYDGKDECFVAVVLYK